MQRSRLAFYRGYLLVAGTVILGLALWLYCLAKNDAWYDTAWKYPAKIGSHGTLMLMCWAFILATRFRIVEWLFGGLDKVYKAHRHVGEAAFFLIFLHPVFLALSFTDSPIGFLRYLWFSGDWVRNTGLIALLAFALLVTLSIYVKIAYHRWKRTHDWFGLLLVLIVIHAMVSGGEIMAYPILQAWHGFWVVLGLSAYVYIRVLYRFVGPQYEFITSRVEDIGDRITEIHLEPVGRPLHAYPGQFVYISFDSDAVTEEPHPFSLSSPADARTLRLSIKRLGDWTRDASNIKPGELARVWGPYGHFAKPLFRNPKAPAVLIGGGIGITPILSIVGSTAFRNRPGETTLIYSVPREEALVYENELSRFADQLPQLRYLRHLSDPEGFIDRRYLETNLPRELPHCHFFVCGPGPMMESFRKILSAAEVPPSQIVMEEFSIR